MSTTTTQTAAQGNDLCALFNEFSGQKTSYMFQYNDVGGEYQKTNPKDPVIEGMQSVAAENNMILRLVLPGQNTHGYYTPNRINVALEKDKNDSRLVVGKMSLG